MTVITPIKNLPVASPADYLKTTAIVLDVTDPTTGQITTKQGNLSSFIGTKVLETSGDIPTGSTGLVITVDSSLYSGDIKGVDVWHNDIQINNLSIEKGVSGADNTVTIRSSKAYTGANIYITLK